MLRLLIAALALTLALPAAGLAGDAPAAEGTAASKLVGEYSIFLDADTQKQLDEARKKAAAAGAESMEAQLLKMMEAMTQIRVTFTAQEMAVAMGDKREALPYTVISSTDDTVVIEAIGAKNDPNAKERYTIKMTDQGFVMVEDGAEDKATTFLRVK